MPAPLVVGAAAAAAKLIAKKMAKDSVKKSVTTGKVKAFNKIQKDGITTSGKRGRLNAVDSKDSIVKGKNKTIAKKLKKANETPPMPSKRAAAKEANWNNRIQKHPLVRNAGQSSAESKYRSNSGRAVPVKKKK
jgi:hypothetical protein